MSRFTGPEIQAYMSAAGYVPAPLMVLSRELFRSTTEPFVMTSPSTLMTRCASGRSTWPKPPPFIRKPGSPGWWSRASGALACRRVVSSPDYCSKTMIGCTLAGAVEVPE